MFVLNPGLSTLKSIAFPEFEIEQFHNSFLKFLIEQVPAERKKGTDCTPIFREGGTTPEKQN
jgi:hypothetical protein